MPLGKVLIIDDSLLVRNYLSKTIESVSELQIVGMIHNGEIGFQQILLKKPDVVILDLEMQDGDGLYVLRKIEEELSFEEKPFVIIYSSHVRHDNPVFKKAIDFGFCDFVLKIEGTAETIAPNIKKIIVPKIISGVAAKKTRASLSSSLSSGPTLRSLSSFSSKSTTSAPVSTAQKTTPEGLANLNSILTKKNIKPRLLILGASTGGPQVIRSILKHINTSLTIPIVIIQHMPEKFTKSFALELNSASQIPVHELRHNISLEKGHAYVFPGGTHGRLNSFGNLYVYYTDRNNYEAHPFKPSINLAIEHLLHSFHGHVVGAILSGMGSDGAIGMQSLHTKGSLIFAQDKISSAVWGMPGSTVNKNAVDLILTQDDLGKGIALTLNHYGVHSGGSNG